MSKKSPIDAAKEVIDEMAKYLPEEQQSVFRDTVTGSEAALKYLGDAALMRSDYSRRQDELAEKQAELEAYKNQLDEWYQEKLPVIEAGSRAMASDGNDEPPTTPTSPIRTPAAPQVDLKDYIKKSELESLIAQRAAQLEQRSALLGAAVSSLGFKHQKDFNEPIEPLMPQIYDLAAKKQIPLDAAYAEVTAERRAALEEQRQKEARKKLKEELRQEILTEQRANPMLPYAPSTTEPSTLTGLTKDASKQPTAGEYGVQAAVDEFYRSQGRP